MKLTHEKIQKASTDYLKSVIKDGFADIETEDMIGLGFDTAAYLPDNFDPYADEVVVESLNYIEDDVIELGFNTRDFLPEGFDPYGR